MRSEDGVAVGPSLVGIVGLDGGTAPSEAVTGMVFTMVDSVRAVDAVRLTRAAVAISGEVGLGLPGLTGG